MTSRPLLKEQKTRLFSKEPEVGPGCIGEEKFIDLSKIMREMWTWRMVVTGKVGGGQRQGRCAVLGVGGETCCSRGVCYVAVSSEIKTPTFLGKGF